ncbi:helix-turn-helix domain-containing protein [Endobacter medicaginis]|uniref:Helix-turn-helix domain-containing protein n=1 Tax=Endobacter medicaginis TaxID=1181271 RepID=A0A850NUR7_9PROT|nr:helix-turn-helix domain-containing protein [Endobacter medicaginis]
MIDSHIVTRLPRLMKEREVAVELGVSIDTVRRLRKRGEIGHTKIGDRLRYTPEHVQAYLAAGEVAPCPRVVSRSVNTGSTSEPVPTTGAGAGSTETRARHAAHHSALATLRPPRSNSRNG